MNTPPADTASLDEKLRASRLELLDIGLRNNLVSFRKTGKNLAAHDADAEQLLRHVVEQKKKLSWVATVKPTKDSAPEALDEVLLEQLEIEHAQQPGEQDDEAVVSAAPAANAAQPLLLAPDAQAAAPSTEQPPAALDASAAKPDAQTPAAEGNRRKPQLQAKLAPEALFLQLLKIRTEATTLLEEQGANLLFLAVGFLHWYESDSAQEARRAPLILLPCTLVREGASTVFELEPTGDDVVVNLSLAAKLKTDFGISLPPSPDDTAADAEDGAESTAADWLAYLSAVEQAIATQPRWHVARDEVVLGLFSFGKFLMFKDLASETWPDDNKPEDHPVLARLLGEGFGDEPPAYAEDQRIDAVIEPGQVHFVKDADSSQTLALLEACAGRNLVIQGPPGTGKSQTITNLIAELLAQHKSVLFVAEKMAALDVVKRRLDECHLGDAVLELHSHRATKSTVLKELGRTLGQGKPVAEDGAPIIGELQLTQQALNQYCHAVAQPVGASGQNFGSVLGQLLQVQRKHPDLRALPWPELAQWTPEQASAARDVVMRMSLVLKSLGQPQASTYWGTALQRFTPIEENQASQALQQGRSALHALGDAALDLSARLQLTQPAGLADMDVVCKAARRAAQAPRLDGVQLSTHDWQQQRDAIKALMGAGRAMQGLRERHGDVLIDAAWQHPVMPMRQAIAAHGPNWWRFLSGDWRAAKQQLQGLLRTPQAMQPAAMLSLVDDILAHQGHRQVYDAHAALGRSLFGAQWQAEQSEWDVLEHLTGWIVALHDDIGQGQLPSSIVAFLAGHPDASGLGDMADAVASRVAALKDSVGRVTEHLGLAQQAGIAQDWHRVPLAQLAQAFDTWEAQLPQLQHVVRLGALLREGDALGLAPFQPEVARCTHFAQLLPLFDLSRAQALVAHAYQDQPALAQFDRLEHEHRIAQFRELDRASLGVAQTQLASAIWQRKPRANQPGEMAVLAHELNKKRRHIPIRQLIDRAGRAIQQIKPVFMMSPLSIANFLPPGKLQFDVVIFDEASQVKAVDALGAILRGKQVIVVGDTRQMPPTDFFSREVEQDETSGTADIESILSLFKARGCNERYLRWHYRSRHESLIAVSNAEFYDNKLVIFPAAGVNGDATGISLTHLPHAVYDRGRTRTNKIEAQTVAQAVIAHAVQTPHLSLGVAAFSVAQRDLIEVELEMLRRAHPEAEPFFAGHANEPFFVKNLENIQGDERDVMFISIGYGRNESGRIAKEFGPLNRDGGHRRLNVLITRAKLGMRVFSNFTADELALDAGAKHGVRALKNLLKYAQTRELEVATETGRATDSPFEDQVITALRDKGHAVEAQVGTAGYFIDMAIRDPEQPGRYVLAIECDGAAYHSARSARDRDRLRQSVLEGLGWRFHRIWSTDWFRNPGQETERAVQAIEAARAALQRDQAERDAQAAQLQINAPEVQYSEPPPVFLEREANTAQSTPTHAYRMAQLPPLADQDLLSASAQQVDALLRQVVDAEAPVHVDVIARRVMAAYDLSRAGSRIAACLDQGLARAAAAQGWLLHEDFVSLPEQLAQPLALPVRDRAALPAAERKLEWVSPQELQAALHQAVALAFSLPQGEVASTAAQLLGFGRATARMQAAFEPQLQALLDAGVLMAQQDGTLVLSPRPAA